MQKKTSGELKTVSIQFKNAFMHNTVWILPHFLIYIQLDFKPVSTTGLICIFGHFFMKPIYEISFKEIFKKPRLRVMNLIKYSTICILSKLNNW